MVSALTSRLSGGVQALAGGHCVSFLGEIIYS